MSDYPTSSATFENLTDFDRENLLSQGEFIGDQQTQHQTQMLKKYGNLLGLSGLDQGQEPGNLPQPGSHQGPHTGNLPQPGSHQGPHTGNLPQPGFPQGPHTGKLRKQQQKRPLNSQGEQPINSVEEGSIISQQQKNRIRDQRKKRKKYAKIDRLLKEGTINDINSFLKDNKSIEETIKQNLLIRIIDLLLKEGTINDINNFLKDNESIEETIKQNLLIRKEALEKERQTLRKQEKARIQKQLTQRAARRKELREREATEREQQRKKQKITKYVDIIVNPNVKKQDITNIFRKNLPLFQGIEYVDYISPEKKGLFQQKLNKYYQEGFRDRIRRASGNMDDLTKLKQEAPSDAMRELIQASLENEKRKNTQRETNAKKREAAVLLQTGSNQEIQKFIQKNESNEMLKQQIYNLKQKVETQAALQKAIEDATNANKLKATQLLNTGTIQEIQGFIRDNKSNGKIKKQINDLKEKLAAVLLQTGSNQEIQRFIRDNESNAMLSGQILLLKKKLADVLSQTGSNQEIQRFIQDNESNAMLSGQIQLLRNAIIKKKYKTHISNFEKAGSHNNIQTIYANTVGNSQIEPSDRIQGIQNQIRLAHDIYRLSRDFHLTQDEDRRKELYNEMFSRVYSDGKDPSEGPILFNNANMANDENFSNFLQFFVRNFIEISEKQEIGAIHGIDPRALHTMDPGALHALELQNNEELKNQYEFIYRTTQYKTLAEAAVNAGEFVRHEALRNNLINLLPFIEDRQLYQNFLDIFQRMIRSKKGFIDLALQDINSMKRSLIMNGIFPLYLTRVEKVKGQDITDIINTYEIENTDKRRQEISSFINDKYYPNTLYRF